MDQESERVERETQAYFEELGSGLAGVTIEGTVRFGDPLTEILDVAESAGADLIALATHHRGLIGRLTTRSLARRLARATTIPLLLVPYDERAASTASGAPVPQPGTVAPLVSRTHHIRETVHTGQCRYFLGRAPSSQPWQPFCSSTAPQSRTARRSGQ